MILITILLLMALILTIIAVMGISVLGSIGVVLFGDVIVCIAFIFLGIRWLCKRRK